jgi:heme O synthase-like polyprenyltransferase
MTSKRAASLNTIISIGFALAMIGTSLIIADRDMSQAVVFILITIWFVPFFYLIKAKNRK